MCYLLRCVPVSRALVFFFLFQITTPTAFVLGCQPPVSMPLSLQDSLVSLTVNLSERSLQYKANPFLNFNSLIATKNQFVSAFHIYYILCFFLLNSKVFI